MEYVLQISHVILIAIFAHQELSKTQQETTNVWPALQTAQLVLQTQTAANALMGST